jgi:hypothetical protein
MSKPTPAGRGQQSSGAKESAETPGSPSDKTTFIPQPARPHTGEKPTGTAAPGDKTAFIPASALPKTAHKPSGATESSASQPGDPKTVAIPKVPDPAGAETVALPVQRPAEQATEKIHTGKTGTDRIASPAGGRPPISTPPVTPRPGVGPKNPVPQGSSGPAQNAPAGDASAGPPPVPPRPAGAASPADVQHTIPEQSAALRPPEQPPAAVQRPPAPPQPHTIAAAQHIPAATPPTATAAAVDRSKRKTKRWLLVAAAAVIVIAAVITVVVALVHHNRTNSPEAKVTAAINAYTTALASGNLPDLRTATCGAQHDFYQSIAPDQYASVHKLAVDQRKIPKVDAVDSVRITGDKAVAQASVYTDADPTRIAHTFDLQQTAGGWKVCDSPTAGY